MLDASTIVIHVVKILQHVSALLVICNDSNIFYLFCFPLFLHLCSVYMASRESSVSSISSVSSLERRTVDSRHFQHAPTATLSTLDPAPPGEDSRATTNRGNEKVTAEPLLSRTDSGQNEEESVARGAKGSVQTHQTHYRTRSWYYDWWFWEISGALLSLGSTVAIVVMLAVCNNKPLPVLRYGITLNAMLSVLSTIAKVSPSSNAIVYA